MDKPRTVHVRFDRAVGIFVLILSVVTTIYLAYFTVHERKVAHCQAQYNLAVSQIVQKRAAYAEQDRQSVVSMVRAVATAKSSKDLEGALSQFLKTTDRTDLERQRNPFPKISDHCG